MIRIGFRGSLYYSYNKEPPKSIGNCLDPYISSVPAIAFADYPVQQRLICNSAAWQLGVLKPKSPVLIPKPHKGAGLGYPGV